jgi:antitoxin VapB
LLIKTKTQKDSLILRTTIKLDGMAFETISIQNESGSQAIRIPESHKIHDDKVYVKRLGNALYLISSHNPWQNLFESHDKFTPDFMEERSQPTEQQREGLDKWSIFLTQTSALSKRARF